MKNLITTLALALVLPTVALAHGHSAGHKKTPVTKPIMVAQADVKEDKVEAKTVKTEKKMKKVKKVKSDTMPKTEAK